MAKKETRLKPFFTVKETWEKHWQDMPEFITEDQSPDKSLIVNFANKEDMQKFIELINQKITFKTQSIWYPKAEIVSIMNKQYIDTEEKNES
jgi:hypothetical protein